MMKSGAGDSSEIMRIAAQVIADKKGFDIAAFDVARVSTLADYVLISSALNEPHLKALADSTIARLKKEGVACYRRSGEPGSGWIIADYADVMIHFLCREQREYYDLDELFKDAPRVNIEI